MICPLVAQSLFNVKIDYKEPIPDEILEYVGNNYKLDSAAIPNFAIRKLHEFYELGFLAADFAIAYSPQKNAYIEFDLGSKFYLVDLHQGNITDEILNRLGYKPLHYTNRAFSYKKISGLLNSVLTYAENHGYPFATVRLDSIKIVNRKISARINYQSGPYIVFDSLVLSGYEKVKTSYLMAHLGIYKGKQYEEKLVDEISNKIKLLPYITLEEEPIIIIEKGECIIDLKLKHQRVSEIDGIIGFLPNQREGEGLLITGQVKLDLENLFSSGKKLSFEWQSFDAQSQLLDIGYYHPNLFRTPLNFRGGFDLLKQDTTFLNRNFELELSLLSKKSNLIGFRTEFFSSRLLSTTGLINDEELAESSDFNTNYYGLHYAKKTIDRSSLPKEGLDISLEGFVGQKQILKNTSLDDDFYSGVDLNTSQWRIELDVEKIWNVHNNLFFRSRLSGGHLSGDQLFYGDLFRIGGLKSIRGFAEKSFFATSFGILNLEMQAHVGEQTYFMLFFDQSIIDNSLDVEQSIQYPLGAGAGFSFRTDAGIFNFVFAMGKSANQTFSINQSKIHFGYVSRF